MFTPVEFAARIEAAECALVSACARSIGRNRPDVDAFVEPFAGGAAVFAGTDSPLTKIVGVGFGDGGLDREGLRRLEAEFADHGANPMVEVSTLADPAILTTLTRRGYVLRGFENVLGRRLDATIELPTSDGTIAVSDDDELDAWVEVMVEGFASPDPRGVEAHESFPADALRRALSDVAREHLRFAGRREGTLAAGASLSIQGAVALLCGAATVPDHRCHGLQSALLAARLNVATEAGCELAVVTTRPGSTAQSNLQKRGFELLYARAALSLDA